MKSRDLTCVHSTMDLMRWNAHIALLSFLHLTLCKSPTIEHTLRTDLYSYRDCLFSLRFTSYRSSYCLRVPNRLPKPNSRCYTGNLVSFRMLMENGVSVTMLLDWSVPIDMIDAFGAFLQTEHPTDGVLCNCTENTFGRYCEYTWHSETVDQLIDTVAEEKSQAYPTDRWVPCYALIEQTNDDRCLDYRDVCDGEWDLGDGRDELFCDRLEMNECAANEFRCRNGFCIAHQYLFDGDADCLDLSDEQRYLLANKYEHFHYCYQRAEMDCHEHWCTREEFSCGDGQCFAWYKRFWYAPNDACRNRQSDLYTCPIHQNVGRDATDQFVLTRNDGRCSKTIAEIEDDSGSTCLKTILCAVTHHPSCKKIGLFYHMTEAALKRVQDECRHQQPYIPYASGLPFLSPFVQLFYTFEQFTVNHTIDFFAQMILKQPGVFCLIGKRLCYGVEVVHNGSICLSYDDIYERQYPYPPFDYFFCRLAVPSQPVSPTHFRCNNSKEWISKHRLFDGFVDCIDGSDERHYSSLRQEILTSSTKDRYRCGVNASTTTGLIMRHFLGDEINQCEDGTDEMSMSVNWQRVQCRQSHEFSCSILRDLYSVTSTSIDHFHLLPFDDLCNSIWDLRGGLDESDCHEWVCETGWIKQSLGQHNRSQWQGYCIDGQWLCNGIWDFPDGSDEHHCTRTERYIVPQCYTLARPRQIIRLTETNHVAGNGFVECSGGIDERNTHMCADGFPLNHRFLCNDRLRCLEPRFVCDQFPHCADAEDELDFWCGNRSTFTTNICSPGRFSCLEENDTSPCVPHEVRCNDEPHPTCQKSHQDEHMCIKKRRQSDLKKKEASLITSVRPERTIVSDNLDPSPWFCDQGLPVYRYGQRACLCPMSFYGNQCQNHDHRLTVVFTIDDEEIESSKFLKRVVILLYDRNETIDHKILTRTNTRENKLRVYLNYPWSHYPRLRIPSTSFSVQIYLYSLGNGTELPRLTSVWNYPIKFSFLPVNRLAIVLRFSNERACSYPQSFQCRHGQCYRVVNHAEMIYCQCQRGWYGQWCNQKWSETDLCGPNSQSIATNRVICVCAANRYGPTCHIPTRSCPNTFCQHEGRCISYADEFYQQSYRCVCSEEYFGDYCQYRKPTFTMNLTNDTLTSPSVIQLLEYHANKMEFYIERQHILSSRTMTIVHHRSHLPSISLLKIYPTLSHHPELYLTFIGTNVSEHRIIHRGIRCSHAREHQLIPSDASFESLLIQIKRYHRPCQAKFNATFCFYDELNYICFCNSTTGRASCFIYDFSFDQCHRCLHGGRCLAGDRQRNPDDFICSCRRCVYGSLCQYRMDQIGFSFESILAFDLSATDDRRSLKWTLTLYISVLLLIVIVGSISNILSFRTVRQPTIEPSMATRYIQLTTIVNQLTLLALLLQITYVILNRFHCLGQTTINDFLCHVSAYLLDCFTDTSKWFISLLAIHRARNTRQLRTLNNLPVKKHFLLLLGICLVMFSVNSISIVFHRLVAEPRHSPDQLVCIVEYTNSIWSTIKTTTLFCNHLIPFLLNTYATWVIIRTVARSKANVNRSEYRREIWRQIRDRYEQLLCPTIMILCSIPHLLVGFLVRCYDLDRVIRRKLIIFAYLISFIPQMLTFVLFILPSKNYKRIFLTTQMAKFANLFDNTVTT